VGESSTLTHIQEERAVMPFHSRLGWRLPACLVAVTFSATAFGQATSLPQLRPPVVNAPAATASTVNAAPQPDPTASKRAENAELLKVAQKKLDSGDPSNAEAAQAVALYCSVESVLAQQEVVDGQYKDLATRKVELENELQAIRSDNKTAAKPCSFIELDQLKDSLSAEQNRVSQLADRLTSAKAALERAQHDLDDSQRKQRQAQEAVETNQDNSKAADLAADLEQTSQLAKLAVETATLRQKQLARVQLDQQVQKLAVDVAQEQVNRARPTATFSAADLDDQLAQIKRQEDALKAVRDKAQAGLIVAQTKVTTARKQYRESTADTEELLGETLDGYKFARDKLDAEVNISTGQLSRMADLRMAWNERFQIATHKLSSENEDTWAKMKEWQASTHATIEDLVGETRSQIQQIVELRTKIVNVTKRADDSKGHPPAVSKWIAKQQASLEETLRLYESNMVSLESCRRIHQKLLDELGHEVDVTSPTQLAMGTWYNVRQLWGFELTSWEDGVNHRSITVQKVVTGLIVFIAGLIFSRLLSAFFANRMLRSFHPSRDAMTAIRTLAFYALAVGVGIFALNFVDVPLTAFTIFGGAIAIGVGFGSQAVINNFIGGLIMMAERPARIGERIIFGSHDGVVEEVGFRSTKLRTGQDHLVTIPNSTLVHESIENVGRRRTINRNFRVAVGYDTPREKIIEAVEAIRAILDEPGIREPIHPVVSLEKHPPRVHFHEYNADSLSIQIVYWYGPPNYWDYMAHAERVNLRIFEEFDRLGVSFASPSKTVYIAQDSGQQFLKNQASAGPDLLIPPARRAG
jgi:potassium efflux system protein